MSAQARQYSGPGVKDACQQFVKKVGKTCLKCDKRGDVLVCSDADCPIVVHMDCMPCAARFSDIGNFYCPYCWYKRSLVDCHQAKEKVLLGKQALLSFLGMWNGGGGQFAEILKRRKPDSPGIAQNRKNASCSNEDTACDNHPMKVEGGQQRAVPELPRVAGGRIQVGLANSKGWEQGCVAKDDGISTRKCPEPVTVSRLCNARMKEVPIVDNATKIHEKSDRGRDSTFRNYYNARSQVMKSGYAEKSDVIGEGHLGKIDEGQIWGKSLNKEIHPTMDDGVPRKQESGSSCRKHRGSAKTVEGCGHNGVEREPTLREPQGKNVYMTGKGETLARNKGSDLVNDTAFQNGLSQMKGMGDTEHAALSGKDDYGWTGGKKTQVKSPEITVYTTWTDNLSPKPEMSTKKYQETTNTMEGLHYKMAEKEQRQEPRETSVHLTRKDNVTLIYAEFGKGSDSGLDHCSLRIRMAGNTEDVGKHAEVGEDYSGATVHRQTLAKALKNCRKMFNALSTLSESEKLTSKHQETVSKPEGVAVKEHTQVENKARLPKSSASPKQKEIEEFETGDGTVASEESHSIKTRIGTKRKIKMPAESTESSGSSGSRLEDSEEVKSTENADSVKKIKLPAPGVARRSKLPWTIEEVEMLKEGVENFSLTANKNTPWRKVMEFGRHVFDGTRTPDDLRGKWKNIMGKTHASSVKK